MIYEHEKRERANAGEVVHVPMPTPHPAYAPLMHAYLTERELSYELARLNGWYPTLARGPRVVIPCVNSAGFNYWQARSLEERPSIRYDSPAIPRLDSIVLLWPKNHSHETTLVITEGPMDALAAAEFYPAIAIMGGCPSEQVLSFIKKKATSLGLIDWVIVPDNDNPELVTKFLDIGGVRVTLPAGKDLAAMPRWEREKLLA